MAKSELIMKALRQALQDNFGDSKLATMSKIGGGAKQGYFAPEAEQFMAPPEPAPMSQLVAAGTRGGRIQPDEADVTGALITAPAAAGLGGGAAAAGMQHYVAGEQPKWAEQEREQAWTDEQARKLQAMKLGLPH